MIMIKNVTLLKKTVVECWEVMGWEKRYKVKWRLLVAWAVGVAQAD